MGVSAAFRAALVVVLFGTALSALALLLTGLPTDGTPLDTRAALAAVERPVDGLLHVTTEASNPETSQMVVQSETWVDPEKELVYRENDGGMFKQVLTPNVTYTYDDLTGTISEDPAAWDTVFDPRTYYSTAGEVLAGPGTPQKTGETRIDGEDVEVFEADTTLDLADAPDQEVDAKLFVAPDSDLVVREEYTAGGDPGEPEESTIAREIERVPLDAAAERDVLEPAELRAVAEAERQNRLEEVASLPFEGWSLGESFGNARLWTVIPTDGLVRYEYVDAKDTERAILAIVVRDTQRPLPQPTRKDLRRYGPPADKADVPNPQEAEEVVRDGEEIEYEVGERRVPSEEPIAEENQPPDPGEKGGPPSSFPQPEDQEPLAERVEYASFERGRSKVLVQVQGEVRGADGKRLSAPDIVEFLEPADDALEEKNDE